MYPTQLFESLITKHYIKYDRTYTSHRCHRREVCTTFSGRLSVEKGLLEALAGQTSLVIDFGGGIKSDEDLHIAFESGAQMVTLGSIAVKEPDTFNRWMEGYGSERIILGADAKDGKIAVNGWLECSRLELMPFLNDYIKKGVAKVLCTDISRDGMLNGPSLELYKQIMEAHPDLHLIASGGISGMKDIEALNEAGIPAVVFGKAFYEGRITLQDLKAFLP